MKTLELIDLLSPRLAHFGELCMAGGAVRDELMGRTPKDFDLFILWPSEWKFKEIKEQIESRLDGLAQNKPILEWHKSEPYLVTDVKIKDVDVQILCNPAESPEALVDTFDWNVCLFARTASRLVQLTNIDEIAPGKNLKLHRVTFPLSTLRRGFRFSERFKMKLDKEDVTSLCRKIVENAELKNHIGPGGNEPDMPSLKANKLPNDKYL